MQLASCPPARRGGALALTPRAHSILLLGLVVSGLQLLRIAGGLCQRCSLAARVRPCGLSQRNS
eukprot:11903812-Alexandrium_andersonii.AAC.1